MVYNVYNNNENFNELMDNYTTLYTTKSIHNDRIKIYKHFTAYLYDNYSGIKSCSYHFYIKYNYIYSVTRIENIL